MKHVRMGQRRTRAPSKHALTNYYNEYRMIFWAFHAMSVALGIGNGETVLPFSFPCALATDEG